MFGKNGDTDFCSGDGTDMIMKGFVVRNKFIYENAERSNFVQFTYEIIIDTISDIH